MRPFGSLNLFFPLFYPMNVHAHFVFLAFNVRPSSFALLVSSTLPPPPFGYVTLFSLSRARSVVSAAIYPFFPLYRRNLLDVRYIHRYSARRDVQRSLRIRDLTEIARGWRIFSQPRRPTADATKSFALFLLQVSVSLKTKFVSAPLGWTRRGHSSICA